MKKIFWAITPLFFLLFSCEEEFDLSAPYKDITIVYGLLNHNDTTHYIRIQKAFLGDDNALLYCAIPDSLYYPATLDAYILGYNSSGIKVDADSFHLERFVNDVIKDSGLFAAYNNVLYKGDKILNPQHTYQLVIIKPNGDTVTSTTKLTGNMIMGQTPLQLDWEPEAIQTVEKSVKFNWTIDPQTYAYQVSLRFNYLEWKAGSPGNITDTNFTYNFATFKPSEIYECNINQLCFEVTKTQFYGMIVNKIPEDPDNTPMADLRLRRFISIDVIVSQATEELYKYIKLNTPSLSYVQKVTTYTNIENGLGIFGSRSKTGYSNLTISTQTKDSLCYGHYTSQLHFQP